ncbi:hypothetical protein AL043_24570 [Pseudomonas amygdali pv. aesculi]|nr:hypothetical protein AL043_24570 [Pseudomonas amygdali pv. aesculi]
MTRASLSRVFDMTIRPQHRGSDTFILLASAAMSFPCGWFFTVKISAALGVLFALMSACVLFLMWRSPK